MHLRIFTQLSLLLCSALPVLAQTNITANGGLVTAQYSNGNAKENYQNINDNNVNTKYYIEQSVLWIGYQSPYTALVTQYSVTSANDASDRDPKSWTLQGSNNGSTWTTLDTRTNQTFAARFQANSYSFSNTTGYLYYRLNITANNGAGATQLSEWKLLGSASGPAAPAFNGITTPGNGVYTINWFDNSNDETGFELQRSSDGGSFSTIATLSANLHSYLDSSLSAATVFTYRVRAINAAGVSSYATTTLTTPTPNASAKDLTNFTDGVLTDQYSTTGVEGIAKAIDNTAYSKYLTTHNATWLRFYLPNGGIATHYAITSANDAADRDPKSWTFEGSNNGTTWTVLQGVTGQTFAERYKKRTYIINNATTYTYYRLNITANNGAPYTQLAELEIYGSGNGTNNTAAPAAVSGLTAQTITFNQTILDWTDNATTETSYTVERSTDSTNWEAFTVDANNTRFYSFAESPLTKYYFRVRANNANGSSAWVFTNSTTPTGVTPSTWQEHWFQHVELLNLVYSNEEVNIWYDDAVPRSVTWMNQDFTNVWKYVKQNYGSFSDPKLNMVFHSKSGYVGGHPGVIFDPTHDNRNVGDLGGDWTERGAWNVGASVHEVGHIVELGGKYVHDSPAFSIWGDSKWAEIFIYDVTRRLGWKADETRSYNDFIAGVDNFPRPGTKWFKNWFYPIYAHADSSAALNRYFDLVAQYFPKRNGQYTRGMNMGEFVHFWSGAAGYNLKNQADTAFGWNETIDQQFKQARIDFPFTYGELAISPVAMAVPNKTITALVWPNPASGVLHLTLPPDNQYTATVYSLSGVEMVSQRVKGNSAAINVSALQNGVYIVTVTDGKTIISKEKVLINN
jgi:hypothetical protein